jgi:flavodoxin
MPTSDSKILIAYYSRAGQNYVGGDIVDLPVGNTRVVAEMIQAATGGDLFEIDTVAPYPAGYHETTDLAKRELRERARPALRELPADIDGYDTVLLGYPNWWGTPPMAVFTFLEAFDFSGKTIAPFCTHEGSGMGRSERDIAVACPRATVRDGLAIVGGSVGSAAPAVQRWVETSAVRT